MKELIAQLIKKALEAIFARGLLTRIELPFIEVELSREAAHGDYATNVAMVMAAKVKKNPRVIAAMIAEELQSLAPQMIEKIEVAGPGFINLFIYDDYWRQSLLSLALQGEKYGLSDLGAGKKVMVEFVSANPTGPLHIGHARGAIVGDVVANLLTNCGYEVVREYYINDAGNQMNNLGKSVYFRGRQLLGEKVELPENAYQGDYIIDIAKEILERYGFTFFDGPLEEVIPRLTREAAGIIMNGIKEDLDAAGVRFDSYYSEQELYRKDAVSRVLAELQVAGYVYHDGETRWFKSSAFGDEKDRVVVRKNGEPTYFAADLAYHKDKIERGFDLLIDIWGADHHGYIPRMTAGIQSLGKAPETLRVILVQLVNLLRDGQPVAMSTRSGQFVTMREVFAEVGRDAARYNFLMRRSDSHLDFDLELAKKQSNENPVYYVQYAHARIAGILRNAGEKGLTVPQANDVNLKKLALAEEMAIIKALINYPELLKGATSSLEPHRLTFYLGDLAGLFHSYYNKYKVISEDEALTRARLFLVKNIKTVFFHALSILGVTAPERMDHQTV